MHLPKVTQLTLDLSDLYHVAPVPPPSAAPSLRQGSPWLGLGSMYRKEQAWGPPGCRAPWVQQEHSLCVPPSSYLPSPGRAVSAVLWEMPCSPVCPVACPQCMLSSGQHLPSIDFISGARCGFIYFYIYTLFAEMADLKWKQGLGNGRS